MGIRELRVQKMRVTETVVDQSWRIDRAGQCQAQKPILRSLPTMGNSGWTCLSFFILYKQKIISKTCLCS